MMASIVTFNFEKIAFSGVTICFSVRPIANECANAGRMRERKRKIDADLYTISPGTP